MKIFCIGRNYADHAKEMGSKVPSEPMVFMKPSSSLLVNEKPLYYPEFTQELHYEAEIVIKICKNGKYIQPEYARSYFNAIAFGIDFTARDLQRKCKEKGHPWEIAKGFDGSAPISSFIPLSEVHENGISFHLDINGQTVQKGNTRDMIFNFETLICHISKYFKLLEGDMIFTGTPVGVGPVQIGDELKGFIDGKQMLYCQIK